MSNLPAHLQRYQTRDIGTTLSANLGSAMPPHVSIAGGRFTLVDASNNELPGAWFDQNIGVYIDACIIDANDHLSRTYFAGSYNPDAEGVRPDCFSDNGVAPSISASSPQALFCTPDPTGQFGCRWAVWGSHINQNGKKVPKCAEKQKLALLIPGYNIVFLLVVPPKSGSHLREYHEKCKGNDIKIADVLTRIYFKAGAVGELQFQGLVYIDEPTAELRQAAWNEKKTDSLVGRTDVPRPAGAIAAPVQQFQIAPPVQSQAPGVILVPGQPVPVQQTFQQPQPPFEQPQFGQQVQPNQVFQQPQQVQQPGPFAPQNQPSMQQPFTPPVGGVVMNQPSSNAAAPSVGNPVQQAEPTRRRRRTAAEMAAANGAAGQQQPVQQPGGSPQAPFPHPGQDTAPAQNGNFGIAQPSDPSSEVKSMLDDFFGQQS